VKPVPNFAGESEQRNSAIFARNVDIEIVDQNEFYAYLELLDLAWTTKATY
jgi:hypothetical protein